MIKKISILILVLQPFVVFSQVNFAPVITFKTAGYIRGVRLDSLETNYATLWGSGEYYYFDNGEIVVQKEMRLRDQQGKYLVFAERGDITALNLLYYNRWELIESYIGNNGVRRYFLKKRVDRL